jgi:hypothetical protein
VRSVEDGDSSIETYRIDNILYDYDIMYAFRWFNNRKQVVHSKKFNGKFQIGEGMYI